MLMFVGRNWVWIPGRAIYGVTIPLGITGALSVTISALHTIGMFRACVLLTCCHLPFWTAMSYYYRHVLRA